METTLKNKLIGEFMGGKMPKDLSFGDRMNTLDMWLPIKGIVHISNLKYHKSWDWLMPVTDKIGSLGYAFNIHSDAVRVIDHYADEKTYHGGKLIAFCSRLNTDTTSIAAVYNSVLQFIEWYNIQKM